MVDIEYRIISAFRNINDGHEVHVGGEVPQYVLDDDEILQRLITAGCIATFGGEDGKPLKKQGRPIK